MGEVVSFIGCLSLAQPMASAIFELGKCVENRQRRDGRRPANILNHRGPLLIHASKRWVPEHWRWIIDRHLHVGVDEWQCTEERLRSRLPVGRIIGVVDVIGEVWPSGWAYDAPGGKGEYVRQLEDEERRWWMNGFGIVIGERRPFPSHGRTTFKEDPPAMWPGLVRTGALGIFKVPVEVAGGPRRCDRVHVGRLENGVDAALRCVFGVGHSCPHADEKGFGWTT